MEQLYQTLSQRVPADSAPGIVHGDYRLDNVLFDSEDRPAAVIDWELATIGDSLTDLALMVAYGRLAASGTGEVSDVSEAPGFLSEQEIIDRYRGGIDRSIGDFGFYLGLAFFKMAGIFEGIHYRYVNGQTVGDGFSFAGDAVHFLLDAGLNALKER
jgi:aminoglycoside phosphotransferase (APT) family kinase protein